jgi:hypothetical protein
MGGDEHVWCDPFASIKHDKDDDISEQYMMNNHDGSVNNTVNNEQCWIGKLKSYQSSILNYQEQ